MQKTTMVMTPVGSVLSTFHTSPAAVTSCSRLPPSPTITAHHNISAFVLLTRKEEEGRKLTEPRVAGECEMEKQARKRPAGWSDEEADVKSARARTLDDDVDEFFAIIRRIRATSRLSCKANSNSRNPSFQLEDFTACFMGSSASNGGLSGGSGRREGQSTSGREEEGEASEDNGVSAWLSLNVGPCGGGRQLLMKRIAGGSETEAMDSRRCISGGSY